MNLKKENGFKLFLAIVMFAFVVTSMANKLLQKVNDCRANYFLAEDMKKELKGKSMTEIKDIFINGKYDIEEYGRTVIRDIDDNHIQVDFYQHKRREEDADKIYAVLDIEARNTLIDIAAESRKSNISEEAYEAWPMLYPLILITIYEAIRLAKQK